MTSYENNQEGLSRRQMLKAAGLAGLGVVGVTALGACSPSDDGGNTSGGNVTWDKEVDVFVAGSGTSVFAAIASSELGEKSVLIAEKDASLFGGTSATSGGGFALALLSYGPDEGINDTREAVLSYMKSANDGRMDEGVQQAFVDGCDEFAHFVVDTFGWLKWGHINQAFGDYYELHEGSLPDGFGHGSWYPFADETSPLMAPDQWQAYREYVDGHDNIELMQGTTATSLIVEGDTVVGVVVNNGSSTLNIRAGAVVLGTGGFEHDEEMRKLHLDFPYYRSNGITNNTGDAQRMGARIGAQLAYMDRTFGCPHIYMQKDWVPNEFSYDSAGSDAFAPRGFTHSIMVNKKGRRFGDESAMYDTACRAFGNYDTGTQEYVNIPAFWICDSNFTDYFLLPGYSTPDALPEFVFKADTIEELADIMGIDKANLVDELATYNQYAAGGEDPLWHRGKAVSNNTLAMMGAYHGLPDVTIPTSVVGVVEKAPFYACRYVPGMMGGTRGGLRTDGNAQVLDVDGNPIAGLYAVGNCSAGVAGYWAGGATLGQGSVMSYLAAKHITGA